MPSNEPAEEDIVPNILTGFPFKIRSENEKKAILQEGRPQPKLTIVKRDSSKDYNRTFQSSWYSIHKWLCGSKNYNKLFCWPCLLMRPETSSWCSTGIDDLKRFTSLAIKHAICKSHLKAISEYDETLIGFGLTPEFELQTSFKCKEEDSLSDQTDEDDGINFYLVQKSNTKQSSTNSSNSQVVENTESVGSKTKQPESGKVKTKITFKSWYEINKDLKGLPSYTALEETKLLKWRKKTAKQELKNARLIGEKLRCEIDVLKAKVEYYKFLKKEENRNKTHIIESDSIEIEAVENLK